MSAYVSQEKIDEIRAGVDIVHVISDFLSLRKRGSNYIGLCPFHSEKTPSFTVSEEKQIFHCFGCGKGGNVFTFLKDFNNITFPEVLKSLAERAGVVLPNYEDKKVITKEERLLKGICLANHVAQEFYHGRLLSSPTAKFARDYLEKRGIKEETIKEFKLGFAEKRSGGLLKFLTGKNISLSLAEKAGLVISKDSGHSCFERFRGRLMFPIVDIRNRVVGFGGRVLGDGMPKYLNSPETPVFKKSETLYGLNTTKEFIRKKDAVLVVEGYFDLLALYQSGICNVVATLGTALTARHIKLLKRYTELFYTIFDSDVAGKKAAMRSLPLYLEEEVNPKIVLLAGEKDPAQVINDHGKGKMLDVIKKAIPLLDFYITERAKGFNLRDTNGKKSFVKDTVPVFKLIKDPLERGVFVKTISEFTGNREVDIIAQIKKIVGMKKSKKATLNESITTGQSFTKAQESLVKIFLIAPELYTDDFSEIFNNFSDDSLKEIAILWKELNGKGEKLNVSALMDHIKDNILKSKLSALLVNDASMEGEDLRLVLKDCIRTIKLHSLETEKKDLMGRIKKAEERKDVESLKGLYKKKQELQELIQFEKSLKISS